MLPVGKQYKSKTNTFFFGSQFCTKPNKPAWMALLETIRALWTSADGDDGVCLCVCVCVCVSVSVCLSLCLISPLSILFSLLLPPLSTLSLSLSLSRFSLCPPPPKKKRVKQLSETPYTQKEADAAAGLGTYTRPSKVEVNNSSVMEVREESTMQIGGESKDAASHADVEEKQEAPPTLDDIPEPKDKEASMDTAQ